MLEGATKTSAFKAGSFTISTGWSYLFHRRWALDIAFDYQNWSTDHGVDRVFTAAGGTAETRLNEVNWESFTAMIGVAYHF